MAGPQQERPRRIDEGEALRLVLLESTVGATGQEFLRILVRNLCRALDTRGSWVTEYIPERRRLHSLAFWFGDDWVDEYNYDIEGTPCQSVIETCGLTHIPEKLVELYPKDPDLPGLEGVSYLGIPLLDGAGELLGHMAVLDSKPMPEDPRIITIFEVFAQRAAAEIRRLRAEQELRGREEQLSSLIESAMDAVLVVNRENRIVRCNPAAIRIMSPGRETLQGADLGGFLDAESGRLLEERIREMERLPAHEQRFWFPRGLTALRKDGTEFPAEATLSRFEAGGEVLHLLILRDVNERIQIENRMRRLAEEADYYRQAAGEAPGGGSILGKSPKMRALFKAIRQVSSTEATVLILGETGTGKELIARSIHEGSARAEGPLIRVNCAAIPGTLMESEFFGHEKGAFTGAAGRREGRFALADGGTIFLDEVGELPLDLQAKLLRVLQEGEFEPLGGTRTRKVDVRVIAATHRDLEAMVQAGKFRDDLYYRLNVFPLTAPPLRERPEDVPLLAETFASRLAGRMGRRIEPIGPVEIQRLKAYPWPGNVRELQNVIERALILSEGGRLDLTRAMPALGEGEAAEAGTREDVPPGGGEAILTAAEMRAFERGNILRALEATDWKISGADGAARLLGLPTSTLSSRMKALKIRRPDRRL